MQNIIVIACCRSGHNFVMDQIRSWGVFAPINFEDMLPEKYDYMHDLYSRGGLIPANEPVNIIVVRDLLNWWASYMTWIFYKPVPEENIQNMFNVWMAQVKEACGETQHIDNYISINYDAFKRSDITRMEICEIIGGNYSELRINQIPEPGGGSSFDSGVPGQAMETGLRYKQAIEGSNGGYYCHVLSQNQEAIELYKKHFNLTEDQKELCRLIN